MEVMYLGKPCVVSKCDGNKDIIETGVNGYLCDTVEEYKEAITKLVNDKGLGHRFGTKATGMIKEKFSVDVQKKKYYKLFGKLMNTEFVQNGGDCP